MSPTKAANPNMSSDRMSRCWPLGGQNAAENRGSRSDDWGEATRWQLADQPRDRRKGRGQASNVSSSPTIHCAALGVNWERTYAPQEGVGFPAGASGSVRRLRAWRDQPPPIPG